MRRTEASSANRLAAGAPALIAAALLWVLCTLWPGARPAMAAPVPGGTLLLPPSLWGIGQGWLVAAAMALTAITASGLWSLVKAFNLLPGPGALYSSLLLVMAGTAPLGAAALLAASFTGAISLWATAMLFSLYGRRQPAMKAMLLFSLLSWGSMAQSALLLLAPVFVLGAVFLKALNIKSLCAALLGLALPYWIVLGLGLAQPACLDITPPHDITRLAGDPARLIWLYATGGLLTLFSLMLALYNSMHTLSAGVRMRAYQSFVTLLLAGSILLMLFDSGRLAAYWLVMAWSLSLATTRTFYLSRTPRAWLLPTALCAALAALFFLSL